MPRDDLTDLSESIETHNANAKLTLPVSLSRSMGVRLHIVFYRQARLCAKWQFSFP